MTTKLQASGAISLANIQTMFGGSNPIAITEYYRGGAYVPNFVINAGIPTSGAISLSNFYGTAKTLSENHTLTVGNTIISEVSYTGFASSSQACTSNIGSLSPSSFDGVTIAAIFDESFDQTNRVLELVGDHTSSSPFDTLTLNGLASTRASATVTTSGGNTIYRWSNISLSYDMTPGSGPFTANLTKS